MILDEARFDSRAIFLKQCHFQNFAAFVSKRARIEVIEEFMFSSIFQCLPRIVTLQNYVMPDSASLKPIHACTYYKFYKASCKLLYPGEPNNGHVSVRQYVHF